MEKEEMDFWHNQNNMTDSDIFEGNYKKRGRFIFYKDNTPISSEEGDVDTEKIYGSNGGLSDGSDSWKYGG